MSRFPRIDAALRARAGELFQEGLTTAEIARRIGTCRDTARRFILEAGLREGKRYSVSPIVGYRPPPADLDELTPRQRAERETAAGRAYELGIGHNLTRREAGAVAALEAPALAERDGIPVAWARVKIMKAREYLSDIARWKLEAEE